LPPARRLTLATALQLGKPVKEVTKLGCRPRESFTTELPTFDGPPSDRAAVNFVH
jgi:hypothetical protein